MTNKLLIVASILSVLLLFICSPLWAIDEGKIRWGDIVTVLIAILAVFISVYSIRIAIYDTEYRTCLTYLEAIEYDLNTIQLDTILELHPQVGEELRKYPVHHVNGTEFQHLYNSFFNFITNDDGYRLHLQRKDDAKTYSFYIAIQSMEYYLLSKQLYSYEEIIVVIKEAEKSGMTNLQKKFIFRKIRRITYRYFQLLESKRTEALSLVIDRSHAVNEYFYDLPFYEERMINGSLSWRRTSLFSKTHYDELYKAILVHKIDVRGFNAASNF